MVLGGLPLAGCNYLVASNTFCALMVIVRHVDDRRDSGFALASSRTNY